MRRLAALALVLLALSGCAGASDVARAGFHYATRKR